jgi:hypothetical protein
MRMATKFDFVLAINLDHPSRPQHIDVEVYRGSQVVLATPSGAQIHRSFLNTFELRQFGASTCARGRESLFRYAVRCLKTLLR